MTEPRDIKPSGFPTLSWLPQETDASLDALAAWVEAEASASIAWYLREKRSKAHWSRSLRIIAIVLGAVGAAVPFVAALTDEVALEWGYLALVLAGAAMAFDRFFGCSTAWMRYVTAELTIQRLLGRLRLERAALQAGRAGRSAAPKDVAAELELLSSTATAIQAEVTRETLAWVSEFQSNVAALNALASGPQAGRGGTPGR